MALAPDSVELFCLSLSLWTQYGRCSKFQVCLDCLHNLYVYRLLGFYTDGMLYGGQAQSDKSAHGNSANNPAVVCWFRCLLFNCQNSSVVQGLGGIGGNISKSLHRFFITGGSYEDR